MPSMNRSIGRRRFLKRAALGGAALGLAAALPARGYAAEPNDRELAGISARGAEALRGSASGARPGVKPGMRSAPIIAYAGSAKAGEVIVMVGSQELVLQNRQLAARLADLAARRSGPTLAFVRDAATGEVVVMTGEHEIVVREPALAARLAVAAHSAAL